MGPNAGRGGRQVSFRSFPIKKETVYKAAAAPGLFQGEKFSLSSSLEDYAGFQCLNAARPDFEEAATTENAS